MATTRHFTRHINAGETIAEAIKDCIDYGKNPDKTQDGKLISAYECDPATVDAEFLLSKSKYKAITGRVQKWDEDILCYQIRQSFLPGEVTPEEANRIGYELGMKRTKANTLLLSQRILIRPTSTTTFTTIQRLWTVPGSFGISGTAPLQSGG